MRRVVLVVMSVVLICAGAGVAGVVWLTTARSTAGEVDFVNRLPVPPLAPSTIDRDGRRVFTLRAAEGRHDFGGPTGPTVRTWGFNGAYLGPTLRATRGEQVAVNISNSLPERTTVHWHGMHLPAAMDGGPHQPIAPGGTWSPSWKVDQPAATLWYHPHPHGQTARHVYRGLAGMFIVDDPGTSAAALPHEYGVDDVPVIVQDKGFDGGRLDEDETILGGTGILGDTIVVNGAVGPYLDVTTQRVRLRLLNASNGRIYQFAFADGRPFALVGTDGGLLPAPHRTNRLMVSPGERAEIVVTMRPGERTVLRSTPHEVGGGPIGDRFVGSRDTLDILELRAAAQLAARPDVPDKLVDVPRLDPKEAAARRDFRLGNTSINGRGMDMGRVDATVTRDSVEVWTVTNRDGSPHNFHVHDVQFQVLRIGGDTPPPHLRGWKDTVFTPPNEPVELIMRFSHYSDPATPYMFHCHLLRHEDQGLMGQFVVVEPGQKAQAPHPHR